MIFAALQLQEKSHEMQTHLHTNFLALAKAFDRVNRQGLWKIMQKFDCPERFTSMVCQLHDGMIAYVTDNGAVSEAFAVTNAVKQDSVLAPTLFSFKLSALLVDAYCDERPGIRIAHRIDGRHLNSKHKQAQRGQLRPRRTTCSPPTTAHFTPRPKKTCDGTWISSPPAVLISDWPSIRAKRWSCINRHRTLN
nr:unnamed protein product [Spirometra erinaceieuropaei]